MNFQRAEQIFNSEDIIEVLYKGSPVWIEELNEDEQTAMIVAEDTDESHQVAVGDLKESGKQH